MTIKPFYQAYKYLITLRQHHEYELVFVISDHQHCNNSQLFRSMDSKIFCYQMNFFSIIKNDYNFAFFTTYKIYFIIYEVISVIKYDFRRKFEQRDMATII